NVRRWALRFRWPERVMAYDAHLDEQSRMEMARERIEMRKRQAQVGMMMQAVAAHGLRQLQAIAASRNAVVIKPGEIAQLMAEGARMERAARGDDVEGGKYTQIIVNIGDAVDEPDANADADALSDDTTGVILAF